MGDDEKRYVPELLRGVFVGLLENVPQIYLSTSMFALTFKDTDTGTKALQLCSLTLSTLSLLDLCFKGVLGLVAVYRARTRELGSLDYCFALSFALLPFTIVPLCAARVYHAFQCDSHLWNLTTGCVEVPQPNLL